MSKATNEITSKFRKTYVLIGDGPDIEIQKALLSMGFKWRVWESGKERKVNEYAQTYISVHEDYQLMHSSDPTSTPNRYIEPGEKRFTEVTRERVLEAAEKVRKVKREESKASKKRRAQRKWDATARKNCFIGRPVRADVVVAVKFRDGSVATGKAGDYYWDNYGQKCDIVGYKVLDKNSHRPKPELKPVTVTAEQMFADIAGSMGKGVAVVPVTDGWIVWDGSNHTKLELEGDAFMAGPVPKGSLVDVKFRDGEVVLGKRAGHIDGPGRYAAGFFWAWNASPADIVAYRIASLNVGSLSSLGGPVGTLTTTTGTFSVDATGEVKPDTNPKKQYGVASIPLEMWPDLASAYGALGLYNGSLKYGKANFANTPVEASIYIAAARRHLAAWCAGEEFDPADGVPNLGGVLANIAILLEARAAGTLIDDRMLMTGYLKERDALKALVKPVQEVHAGKNPHHYTRDNA